MRSEDLDANMSKISEDKHLGIWRGPFVYSYFDTRVVRRSNMLLADLGNCPYGKNFNFLEYMMLPTETLMAMQAAKTGGDSGDGAAAAAPAAPKGGGGAGVDAEKARLMAEGKYYTQGEGPNLDELDDAWVGYFLWAESEKGHEVKCSFVGKDGYFETARVAVETALTLRFDYDQLAFKGGVLTPTVSGGTHLAQRMINSGVKYKMGEWHSAAERCPPPY